ncbi:MAG: iagB [Rhodospirillales bacterium]|nr:iagB [Rhodospirillales bacterium]
MRRSPCLLLFAGMLTTGAALADCYDDAGAYYRLSPSLLRAIAYVESNGDAGAIGGNSDGSLDLCAMQINSRWLPKLAGFGITGGDLLANKCTCIYSGAWILAGEVDRHGYSWEAVARYHGPNQTRGVDYVLRVFGVLNEIKRPQSATSKRFASKP